MNSSGVLRLLFIIGFILAVAYCLMWLWKRNQYIQSTGTPASRQYWVSYEYDFLFFFGILLFSFVVWQIYDSIRSSM